LRRSRTWLGVGLLAGAGLLLVGAAIVPTGPDTSATTATATRPPSTVAPMADPTVATMGSATSTAMAPPSTTTTTTPLSPLAALVGPPQPATPAPVAPITAPVDIAIDALGVRAPVVAVGVESDGQLQIPDERHAGWYQFGAAPGRSGATVIAAHVNWHHVDGPFVRLRELEPGAVVVLILDDGSQRSYQVVERQQFPKDGLPADRIWTHDGPETLVLITCGGTFNPAIRRYRDNVVVFAVPIA
jgi:Sortase domain